jgi:hypothetical protein
MESIIIGPDRIKLMLSGEELKSYGLDRRGDIDSALTGTVLRKILRDAGVDTALSRLHVQVYDCGANGCEMFIALLPEEIVCDEANEASAVVLESRSDLFDLLSRLNKIESNELLSIYRDESTHYALFEGAPPHFAGDYGSITGGDRIPYVLEYATPVCIKVTAGNAGDYL